MLFNKRLLKERINNFTFPEGEKLQRINKIINGWQIAIADRDIDQTKEKSIQGKFLEKFFGEILGYNSIANGDEYTLIQHPSTEVDSKEPDGALGFFRKGKKIFRVVIELKDAKTSLDKKQTSRKENYTPVEQAFGYLTKYAYCDWVIVSNFKEIRLYHKGKGQTDYEKFEIMQLLDDKEFKRFYFILCKENFISRDRNSIIDQLVQDTSKQEEDITKEFYKEFKALRKDLFGHLIENNPEIEKKCLLEKTQKLLDRLIFVLFCEDTAGLLPTKIVKKTYELGIGSRERSDQRVWREFKNLFIDINEGRTDIEPRINAYNGGLFADDEILDNLIIKDSMWEKLVVLAGYDFESELNVNILGHIFEQSLSDLEALKAELDGKVINKTTSKRKKEGIFYTPEYITRYIVEQTVGKYLEEYPDKLDSIKILDPACGSGAFLNQAHSFLREQHDVRFQEKLFAEEGFEELEEFKDEVNGNNKEDRKFRNLKLFAHVDPVKANRTILLNNLYGVDLNDESVEITKLSLWLKTANRAQPLENLDNNIKVGNSLIEDPEFAGEKAFKWEKEFREIFKDKELKAFLITWVTHNSRVSEEMVEYGNRGKEEPIYLNEKSEILITREINSIINEDNLNCLAYNICGDHVHIILVCEESDVESKVQKLKSISSRNHNIAMGWSIPDPENQISKAKGLKGTPQNKLWAKGYNASFLETEEHLLNAIEYVKNNRKKHGLKISSELRVMTHGGGGEFGSGTLAPEYTGGFDVVIGNPPYVRQEVFSDIKPYLQKNYEVYSGVSDLYVYFFEKGLSLLIEGGYFAFIVSNKFLKSAYGKKLTKYLQENYKILQIIDFCDLQLFEGATTMPCIVVIKKEKAKEKYNINYIKLDKEAPLTNLNSFIEKNQTSIESTNPNNSIILSNNDSNIVINKIKQHKLLSDFNNNKIYNGIKTGCNDAFFIDSKTKEELCKADHCEDIIKPYIRGQDINRYYANWCGLWLIMIPSGWTNKNKGNEEPEKFFSNTYPAIYQHFQSIQQKIENGEIKSKGKGLYNRDDKGDYWWELRKCAYYNEFDKPKIIYPEITKFFPFIYDDEYFYTNNKCFMMTASDNKVESVILLKFLTAYFNSKISKFLIEIIFPELLGGTRELREVMFRNLPVPKADFKEQEDLAKKADILKDLTKSLFKNKKLALDLIISEYKPKKLSQKLESFYKLGWNEFVEELEKQKVKLSLKQKEELMLWFRDKQAQLQNIEKLINDIDREIDQEIYRLYDLTEEEIKIIEESFLNQGS